MEGIKINSIKDIYINIPLFKKHGHKVDPHWLIDLKTSFLFKTGHGYKMTYKLGYFFWIKNLGMI